MICPNRHQRTKPYVWIAIGVPHANGDSIMIVLHAKLDATFSAPGSFRCVGHIENIGHPSREGHSARSRVKVTDFALKVVHLGLPRLDGCWLQCLLEFLRSETITDG